jgi:hypothetical protein
MYRNRSLLKRSVLPEDIAEACYFFASDTSPQVDRQHPQRRRRQRAGVHTLSGRGEIAMSYDSAKAAFADWGVDTEAAIDRLGTSRSRCIAGKATTSWGSRPARRAAPAAASRRPATTRPGARTPDELRADLEFAYSMIPGRHRLNLHAMYMDTDETPDRDEIEYRHFAPGWTGRRTRASVSTSTRPSLPMPRRTTT